MSDAPPPAISQPRARGHSTLTLTLMTLFAFFAGTGTGAFGYWRLAPLLESGAVSIGGCSVATWWTEVAPSVTRFVDEAETATQTSRMSLSPVILSMRETQREFEAISTPDCAAAIREDVVSGMSNVVSGFNDFLGQQTPGRQWNDARIAFNGVYQQLVEAGVSDVDGRLENVWASWED